ncbi:hypothetical protein AGLY_014436 [Aphis glycines]|uniref:MULE transposase domain-containing protein n=1 Tax=Aphis glycines TaxID=307491 RepID=A0A6G0T3V2_APHGL|nr:hypothetical protein AGLY_014436 [Aphis glycines]
MIKLTGSEFEETVKIEFWENHCGYEKEIGQIALDKETKLIIAAKLKEGVTFEHIIDWFRDAEVTDDTHRRSLLLEQKDLHNTSTISTLSMLLNGIKIMQLDENDWVGEEEILNKHHFALILITKFQQETLQKFGCDKIYADGTHGTNAYDIQLYSVITVDEFGSGCSVTFCLSIRSNELILKLFFENIKLNVGGIDCKVFMTDDAPAFYNAWVVTMEPVEHRLLCTWHVDKNWRQNLSKISGGSEKKSLILLQTTSDEEFKNNLQNFIIDLKQDKATSTFGAYFKKYYSKQPDLKRVKHFVKTINALMKYSKDTLYKHLIKLSKKNIPTEKVQRVRQSHNSSKSIKLEQIRIVEDTKVYIIKSLSNPS